MRENGMSVCSNCYHRIKHKKAIEVGQLWNNEPFLGVVCSDKCKEEIEKKFPLKVFVGDPWARTVYQDGLKQILDGLGPRMAVSIGLAMRNIVKQDIVIHMCFHKVLKFAIMN